jgi:hypothetical protein
MNKSDGVKITVLLLLFPVSRLTWKAITFTMYDGLMFEATTHNRAGTKQTSEINVLLAATVLLHAHTVQCLMCPGCGTACKLPHGTVSNSWKWNTAVIVLLIQHCPACYCRRSADCCISKLETLILQECSLLYLQTGDSHTTGTAIMCLLTPSLYGYPKSFASSRTALFWVIKQQAVVISYPFLSIQDGTNKLSWNAGKKLLLFTV